MTKKGHQKFSVLKWNFFPKKVILKLWSAKFFPVPPNSAPSLRLWSWVLKVQQTEARSIGYHTEFLFNIHKSLYFKQTLESVLISYSCRPTLYDIIFHGHSTIHPTPKSRGRDPNPQD